MPAADDREVAFRRLWMDHYRHTAYARRRVTAEEVDDVVAEVFLVAWRRLEQVPTGDGAQPWLYGVARRERLRWRLEGMGHQETVDDNSEGHEAVHRALGRLRPPDQELLRLAVWEELTPSEMAVALGCSVNAANLRLHRARKRFTEALVQVEESG
ncbi:MAG: RNA polymerase sigma factor [Acidimicrobiia bacterium]